MAAAAHITPPLVLEFPRQLSDFNRDLVEHLIDRLVELLDEIDGSPDFEPDADSEPWLAGSAWGDAGLDCELDAGESDCDLGWTDAEAGSGFYMSDGDGREIDSVPLLGFTG